MNGRTMRTRFVIMAGLPGTGKTVLAEVLAARLGGIVISKDKVRAALFPPGAITYSSGQNDFCMSVALMAAQRIAADHGVAFIFLDGRTFSRSRHVQQVAEAARLVGAGLSRIASALSRRTCARAHQERSGQARREESRSAAVFPGEIVLRADHAAQAGSGHGPSAGGVCCEMRRILHHRGAEALRKATG